MAGRARTDVRLSDLVHLDSSLHANVHAALLQCILQSQCVDGGCQHAHVVRASALHLAAAVLYAAPEVAAADNNADLAALFVAFFDHIAYRTDDIKVQAEMLIARKGFAANLDQYALIFLCFHAPHSLFYSCLLFYPIFGEFATIYIVLYSGNFY